MDKRNELIDFLKTCSEDKLNRVIEMIKDMIIPTTNMLNVGPEECCPHCGSIHFKKNGKDSKGVQRYRCNECGKTFTNTTGTIFYHSRIPDYIWKAMIDLEFMNTTLQDEAYMLKVSVHTCFRMRHKFYRAVSQFLKSTQFEGEVQLDSAYRKINLKGRKPNDMPRYSKKRGGTAAFSGISHHKICIVSAVDEKDHMMLKIAGLGSESFEKYAMFKDQFAETAKLIVGDSKPAINLFANDIEAAVERIPTKPNRKCYETENGYTLAELNELDSQITTLITTKRGVNTKYFQEYLDFIVFKKYVKYKRERKEWKHVAFDLIKNMPAFTEEEIINSDLPISLKDAYYEYHYGIFGPQNTD